MRITRIAGVVAAVIGAGAFTWQQVHEDQEGLLARAKVSIDDARATATAAVPGGKLIESEIEEEDGRLVYCFEFKVGDQIKEAEVDAITGALIGVEADDEDDDEEDEAEKR